MKLTDILSEDLVVPELFGESKDAVLHELAEHVSRVHPEIEASRLVEVLWERERHGSTAMGDGIAIPHGKLPVVRTVLAAFGRHSRGVDFNSLDGNPTRLFFLLVVPEDSVSQHLKALARISRLLKESSFRQRLLTAPDQASLYRCIREEDDKY